MIMNPTRRRGNDCLSLLVGRLHWKTCSGHCGTELVAVIASMARFAADFTMELESVAHAWSAGMALDAPGPIVSRVLTVWYRISALVELMVRSSTGTATAASVSCSRNLS